MSNFNVPYLVGDTLVRDHQLWPTIKRHDLAVLLGGDTDFINRIIELAYPIGVNLATIQVMMWRVREWTMEASTWTSKSPAFRGPVVGQDDIAELNDSGTTPAIVFELQRFEPEPSPTIIKLRNERDKLAEWRNQKLGLDFVQPAGVIPIWKTLRNLGVSKGEAAGSPFDPDDPHSNGVADPAGVTDNYFFTEPYSHVKFGESGATGGGDIRIFMQFGYVIYDPTTKLFYPQIRFANCQLPIFRAGRSGLTFYMAPASPVVTPPEPDIICGAIGIEFADSGPVPISIPLAVIRVSNEADPNVFTIPLTSAVFNPAIKATKFWPYRNSLGEPIFDETTGAPTGNDPGA